MTSTTTTTVDATTVLNLTSSFPVFVAGVNTMLGTTEPAKQLTARGIYNRATNTFTAAQIDFAL